MDRELLTLLGQFDQIPVTYAGGVGSFADLEAVEDAGRGRVDVTIGSALDLFGGNMKYGDVLAYTAKRG